MNPFEIFGIFIFVYYIIQIVLWIFLDSDIELFLCEKFGKSISTLNGKVIWITGASSGIGKNLAFVLAKNGCKLCLTARRYEELERVKIECLKLSNGKLTENDILIFKMDMIELDKHGEYFNKVVAYFGELSILVNNAGRSQRALFHQIDINVDKELFELDVFSVLNLSRLYVRYLCENNRINKGHIVVNSSMVGLMSIPNSASYTGAKHAINGYFNTLRIEMPEIPVTIICPGPTHSEFLENCFTEQTGNKYGKTVKTTDIRMSTERCAFLMATAIANKTQSNFMGLYPVPLLLYVSMYYPNFKPLLLRILGGNAGLNKIRDSN